MKLRGWGGGGAVSAPVLGCSALSERTIREGREGVGRYQIRDRRVTRRVV